MQVDIFSTHTPLFREIVDFIKVLVSHFLKKKQKNRPALENRPVMKTGELFQKMKESPMNAFMLNENENPVDSTSSVGSSLV